MVDSLFIPGKYKVVPIPHLLPSVIEILEIKRGRVHYVNSDD